MRDSAGVAITTVNTDALGYYEFTSLQPGSYRITEANLATWISTGDADGAANTTDRIDVTLAAGDNKTQQNFGDVRPGSIAGIVFNDANNNGVQDGGEGPLANVNVCATPVAAARRLRPDRRHGRVPDPERAAGQLHRHRDEPGRLPQHDAGHAAGERRERPERHRRELRRRAAGGEYLQHQRHGVREHPQQQRCLRCGRDAAAGRDGQAVQRAGAVIVTTTTDAGGNYTLRQRAERRLHVVETDPILYVSVNDADGGTDNTVAVTVAGANVIDKDFVDTPQPGGLQGTVYEDLNLNGQHDAGEPGIPGVTVNLNTR